MRKIIVILAIIGLSGCGTTFSNTFANRVACTVANDKAFFVSEYGPLGVSAVIDGKDAAAICGPVPVATPAPPVAPVK